MQDMLANLMTLPTDKDVLEHLGKEGIVIRRALAPDKLKIVEWVTAHSGKCAAGECDVCFSRIPVSCFVATREREILGYACYNATALDFFGPTRVLDTEQSKGIGKALLLRSLYAMREEGFVYAIIGGVGPVSFYEKCIGATLIPHSTPGVYKDFLSGKSDPL